MTGIPQLPSWSVAHARHRTPWTERVLDLMRRFMRFVLWSSVFVNLLMISVFLVFFTFSLLRHLWTWCSRVLFPGTW